MGQGQIRVPNKGRWAHDNIKLLHSMILAFFANSTIFPHLENDFVVFQISMIFPWRWKPWASEFKNILNQLLDNQSHFNCWIKKFVNQDTLIPMSAASPSNGWASGNQASLPSGWVLGKHLMIVWWLGGRLASAPHKLHLVYIEKIPLWPFAQPLPEERLWGLVVLGLPSKIWKVKVPWCPKRSQNLLEG